MYRRSTAKEQSRRERDLLGVVSAKLFGVPTVDLKGDLKITGSARGLRCPLAPSFGSIASVPSSGIAEHESPYTVGVKARKGKRDTSTHGKSKYVSRGKAEMIHQRDDVIGKVSD